MISLTPTCRCFHLHVPSPMRRFLFVIGAIEPCTSLHGATGRDKVHPPCTRLVPFALPAAPSRPQSLANDCAHDAPRSSRLIDPPWGRTSRFRRVTSSASHSTGQSVGVSGVFPPCRTCAKHWLPPPPPAPRYADPGCECDAFSEHCADALVSRPLHHGFAHVVCGGFGVVVGVSLAP